MLLFLLRRPLGTFARRGPRIARRAALGATGSALATRRSVAPRATKRRTAGTTAAHLFELLLLLGGEDLVEAAADFCIEVIELLLLLFRKLQILTRERGKNGKRTTGPAAPWPAGAGTTATIILRSWPTPFAARACRIAIGSAPVGTAACIAPARFSSTRFSSTRAGTIRPGASGPTGPVWPSSFSTSRLTPIGTAALRSTATITRTRSARPTGAASTGRPLRPDFVAGKFAVAVPVEFFQRLAGRLNFFGRKLAVVVFVERFEERAARGRGRSISVGTGPPFGRLGVARQNH